jgi:hypothetical protein
MLDDFYDYGAWNIKKPHVEERGQIALSVIQLLKNIHNALNGLNRK